MEVVEADYTAAAATTITTTITTTATTPPLISKALLGKKDSVFRTVLLPPVFFFLCICTCLLLGVLIPGANGLGSMATIAASYNAQGHVLVCSILQGSVQRIQCWSSVDNSVADTSPSDTPFLGVSGGNALLCALRHDTARPICWNIENLNAPHRLKNASFSQLAVGDSFVCALSDSSVNGSNAGLPFCWRDEAIASAVPAQLPFSSLASGADFVCGLQASEENSSVNPVQCWGNADSFRQLPNATFRSIQAGAHHACGLTETFNVQCWGDNAYNQRNSPDGKQFLALALGYRHSCGIDAFTRYVVCWGDSTSDRIAVPPELPFIAIAAGDSFTCGVLYTNFSTLCWGAQFGTGKLLPLNSTVPGFCTAGDCESGSFQLQSSGICADPNQRACTLCRIGCRTSSVQTGQCETRQDISCTALSPVPSPSPPPPTSPSSSPTSSVLVKYKSTFSKGYIALTVLGALGSLCGLLAIAWWIWARLRYPVGRIIFDGSHGKVHNSTSGAGTSAVPSPTVIKRQRSSTSSMRSRGDITAGRGEAFTIAEMEAATMGFSDQFRIATGSFGVVYRGMLPDGREVAIKRGVRETVANDRRLEEKESAFQSELEFLSRLHHKHLVSLVGYCDEDDERMLVYDYMPNGTLHDHLHGRGGVGLESGVLPWPMRIKIALEAARGVEYLHTYALPPIIHRDIKSSNILLDGSWSARVSDFGLSTHSPGENSHVSLMAAGTLGYMDPEYYRLQHLTIKSDVYSFGVVLLELLTGERAIHKHSHGPVNIVDFAVPRIENNDLASVLDQRPGAPAESELQGLEIIAHLAARCVRLEGKERPTMTEIVAVLEEAMAFVRNSRSRSQSIAAVARLEIATDDDDGAGAAAPS